MPITPIMAEGMETNNANIPRQGIKDQDRPINPPINVTVAMALTEALDEEADVC
jgi:hypothetical protein